MVVIFLVVVKVTVVLKEASELFTVDEISTAVNRGSCRSLVLLPGVTSGAVASAYPELSRSL